MNFVGLLYWFVFNNARVPLSELEASYQEPQTLKRHINFSNLSQSYPVYEAQALSSSTVHTASKRETQCAFDNSLADMLYADGPIEPYSQKIDRTPGQLRATVVWSQPWSTVHHILYTHMLDILRPGRPKQRKRRGARVQSIPHTPYQCIEYKDKLLTQNVLDIGGAGLSPYLGRTRVTSYY